MATKISNALVDPSSSIILTPNPANVVGVDGDVITLNPKFGSALTLTTEIFGNPSVVTISMIGNIGAGDFYLLENYTATAAELIEELFTLTINKPTLTIKYHIVTLTSGTSPYLKFTVL